MSYAYYEMETIRLKEQAGELPKTSSYFEWLNLMQEVMEIRDAIKSSNPNSFRYSVGRAVVSLITLCAASDVDLVGCLSAAYEEMKDNYEHSRDIV